VHLKGPDDRRRSARLRRALRAPGYGGGVLFLIANRRDLSAEEHPFFAPVLQDLRWEGVRLRFASIP
jgi:hypothetical protein